MPETYVQVMNSLLKVWEVLYTENNGTSELIVSHDICAHFQYTKFIGH